MSRRSWRAAEKINLKTEINSHIQRNARIFNYLHTGTNIQSK